MTRLVWLSDPHFVANDAVINHDPRVRLDRAINFINEHYSDSAYCVVSGDLVDQDNAENYAAISEALAGLRLPILPMVGNHDDRQALRSVFSLPENSMSDFIQYVVPISGGNIICLDTLKRGASEGELCTKRQQWLGDVLDASRDVPVFIFMHHPPAPLGLPMQDGDRLDNGAGFLKFLSNYPNVRYLFLGHVHRAITGTMNGIPFSTMRSILYQAPAPLPAWNWETFSPGQEAPNIGVIDINGADVCLQYIQFCDYPDGAG